MKYIIDDIDLGADAHKLEHFGLTVVCARTMSSTLIEQLKKKNFNRDTTVLVFPGNGGDIIRRFLESTWLRQWQCEHVFAQRYWIPGNTPVATTSRIFPHQFKLNLHDVVIVDDVVSSGETVRLIKQRNEPWIPRARWHVATWLIQKVTTLPGFHPPITAHTVGDRNRKFPINSLSTFLSQPEIAENYARRNLHEQANAFLKFLEDLRNTRS